MLVRAVAGISSPARRLITQRLPKNIPDHRAANHGADTRTPGRGRFQDGIHAGFIPVSAVMTENKDEFKSCVAPERSFPPWCILHVCHSQTSSNTDRNEALNGTDRQMRLQREELTVKSPPRFCPRPLSTLNPPSASVR